MSKNIDIEEAVKYLQDDMNTYDKQEGYERYNDKTFINDILYGLGVAIGGDKYKWIDGYRKFKKYLQGFLEEDGNE